MWSAGLYESLFLLGLTWRPRGSSRRSPSSGACRRTPRGTPSGCCGGRCSRRAPTRRGEERTSLVVSGVSALGVEMILPLPPSSTSHTQPEPKRPMPAAMKSFAELVPAAEAADQVGHVARCGRAAAAGFRLSQKKVWFQTCAALLNTPPELRLDRPPPALGCLGLALEQPLELRHVRLVVLLVVVLEGLRLITGSSASLAYGSAGTFRNHLCTPFLLPRPRV